LPREAKAAALVLADASPGDRLEPLPELSAVEAAVWVI